MFHPWIRNADLAGHKNLQVILAACVVTVALASSAQESVGAFGFTVWNPSCNAVSFGYNCFAGIGGNAIHVGQGSATLPPCSSRSFIVSFSYPGIWGGGTAIAVDGSTELNPYLYRVGAADCAGCSVNPPTNNIGTNVQMQVVWVPLMAGVRQPDGTEKSQVIRIYKKTVFIPTN